MAIFWPKNILVRTHTHSHTVTDIVFRTIGGGGEGIKVTTKQPAKERTIINQTTAKLNTPARQDTHTHTGIRFEMSE